MKQLKTVLRAACAAAVAVLGLASAASAAPLTNGNLVIYRVGDGVATLGTTAAAVFIDEYTPAGTLVQSIAVPSTGATALTATGNSTTEGNLNVAPNGSVIFTGYRRDAAAAVGTATRLIGTLDAAGNVSTFTTTYATGSAPRSATTDGTVYYISGAGGVAYIGDTSTGTITTIDTRNSRQVSLGNIGGNANTLVAANGSTAITGKVQSYGVLPTATTAATPLVSETTADAVQGFFLADLSPSVAGADTIYLLSTVAGRLRKYTSDGTTWTLTGEIATTAQNVAGVVSGSNVTLYTTTGAALSTLTDASGYNGTLAGTLTSVATAGTNTGFRGVAIVSVVPEPASLSLLGLAAAGLVRRRRA
jgi:hypothetical protein